MEEVRSFLDELSSGSPIPGGGSVAALQLAMAGALLSMVANLTVGRKKYANVQQQIERALLLAQTEREEAQLLASDDADAYGAVAEAMSLPKDSQEQADDRQRRIQLALKGAVEPPLRTMTLANEVLELCAQLVEIGNRSGVSDVGVAALAARAGFYAAKLNVDINLAAIRDADWVGQKREAVRAIPIPDPTEQAVLQRVNGLINGTGG